MTGTNPSVTTIPAQTIETGKTDEVTEAVAATPPTRRLMDAGKVTGPPVHHSKDAGMTVVSPTYHLNVGRTVEATTVETRVDLRWRKANLKNLDARIRAGTVLRTVAARQIHLILVIAARISNDSHRLVEWNRRLLLLNQHLELQLVDLHVLGPDHVSNPECRLIKWSSLATRNLATTGPITRETMRFTVMSAKISRTMTRPRETAGEQRSWE